MKLFKESGLTKRICRFCLKFCLSNKMITCSTCSYHFHLDCLDPPLLSSCENWTCPLHSDEIIDNEQEQLNDAVFTLAYKFNALYSGLEDKSDGNRSDFINDGKRETIETVSSNDRLLNRNFTPSDFKTSAPVSLTSFGNSNVPEKEENVNSRSNSNNDNKSTTICSNEIKRTDEKVINPRRKSNSNSNGLKSILKKRRYFAEPFNKQTTINRKRVNFRLDKNLITYYEVERINDRKNRNLNKSFLKWKKKPRSNLRKRNGIEMIQPSKKKSKVDDIDIAENDVIDIEETGKKSSSTRSDDDKIIKTNNYENYKHLFDQPDPDDYFNPIIIRKKTISNNNVNPHAWTTTTTTTITTTTTTTTTNNSGSNGISSSRNVSSSLISDEANNTISKRLTINSTQKTSPGISFGQGNNGIQEKVETFSSSLTESSSIRELTDDKPSGSENSNESEIDVNSFNLSDWINFENEMEGIVNDSSWKLINSRVFEFFRSWRKVDKNQQDLLKKDVEEMVNVQKWRLLTRKALPSFIPGTNPYPFFQLPFDVSDEWNPTLHYNNPIYKVKAALCPLSHYSSIVHMYKNILTIGRGDDNDVCLSNYGECSFISDKHAVIVYDQDSDTYELINYSYYGTTVDDQDYLIDSRKADKKSLYDKSRVGKKQKAILKEDSIIQIKSSDCASTPVVGNKSTIRSRSKSKLKETANTLFDDSRKNQQEYPPEEQRHFNDNELVSDDDVSSFDYSSSEEEEEIDVNRLIPDSNNGYAPTLFGQEITTVCKCHFKQFEKSRSHNLHSASAQMNHASYVRFGCIEFVFCIVGMQTPQED